MRKIHFKSGEHEKLKNYEKVKLRPLTTFILTIKKVPIPPAGEVIADKMVVLKNLVFGRFFHNIVQNVPVAPALSLHSDQYRRRMRIARKAG